MKATGIVRRIDDLGRVVIPKEIRRTMRIREGDPLEIYTDREGEVIFLSIYSRFGTPAEAITASLSQITTAMEQIFCKVSAYWAAKVANSPMGEYFLKITSPSRSV